MTVAADKELLVAHTHGKVEGVDASRNIDGDGAAATTGYRKLSRLSEHGACKDNILKKLDAAGQTDVVVGARGILGCRTVPIDDLFRLDSGSACARLVRKNVGLHEVSPGIVREAGCPLGGAIVAVVGLGAAIPTC